MYIQSAGSNDSNISKQRIVQKNVDKSFLAKVVLLTCYLKFEPKTENFYTCLWITGGGPFALASTLRGFKSSITFLFLSEALKQEYKYSQLPL